MLSNPFTCPLLGPLEWGQAEVAAQPRGQWEEAPALRSRQLPGFGSELTLDVLVMASGSDKGHIASCPSSLSGWWQFLCRSCWLSGTWGQFVLTWQGLWAGTWAGTCVSAGGGQGRASAMLCVYIHLPSVLLSPLWPPREQPWCPSCTQCPCQRHVPCPPTHRVGLW